MNQYKHMDRVKPARFADWLLERGIPAVSSEEAAQLLGINKENVRQYLAPSRRRGEIISPARGLWVPVPPEERGKGAPEPLSYIDAMMKYLGSDYCVGWLSAAALHGASHQASQVFQVASSRHVTSRSVGNAKLSFRQREYTTLLPAKRITRSSGTALTAEPGPTMLMIAEDILCAGGLDNAATTILELAREHPDALCSVADYQECFSASALRRLGWILDEFNAPTSTEQLADANERRTETISILSPHAPRTGHIDKRWNIMLNRKVEPDL